jgi:hypothetical protein
MKLIPTYLATLLAAAVLVPAASFGQTTLVPPATTSASPVGLAAGSGTVSLDSDTSTLKQLEQLQRKQAIAEAQEKLNKTEHPDLGARNGGSSSGGGIVLGTGVPGMQPFSPGSFQPLPSRMSAASSTLQGRSSDKPDFKTTSIVGFNGVMKGEVVKNDRIMAVVVGDKIEDWTVSKIDGSTITVERTTGSKGKKGGKVQTEVLEASYVPTVAVVLPANSTAAPAVIPAIPSASLGIPAIPMPTGGTQSFSMPPPTAAVTIPTQPTPTMQSVNQAAATNGSVPVPGSVFGQ